MEFAFIAVIQDIIFMRKDGFRLFARFKCVSLFV